MSEPTINQWDLHDPDTLLLPCTHTQVTNGPHLDDASDLFVPLQDAATQHTVAQIQQPKLVGKNTVPLISAVIMLKWPKLLVDMEKELLTLMILLLL